LCLAATLLVPAQGEASLDRRETAAFEQPAVPAHRDEVLVPWSLVTELLKQSAEQPLHFIMSAGPVWLSRCLTAVPWYGWAIVPALAYREWRQWPSERWWDPLLDAGFLILGLIAASLPAPLGPPWRRRKPAALQLVTRRA
jgi:hypothetical protein